MSYKPIQSYHERAYLSLMRGLRELDIRGPCVPSNLVLIGDHAFPLAMNSKGQVLMAASLYGCGRIVVLGHEGYLTAFPALVENALTWLRGDGSDNLSVGVHKDVEAVADNLSKHNFQANVVGKFSSNLGVGVYVTNAYSVGVDQKGLVAFMKAGGGVLIAGQAWNWAAGHPKENTFLQFPGNKVSGVAGIYFSVHYGKEEILPVHHQVPSSWRALEAPILCTMSYKPIQSYHERAYLSLMRGLRELDIRGPCVPSNLVLIGDHAFPLAMNSKGQVLMAASLYGCGRIVVLGHEGYLTAFPALANVVGKFSSNLGVGVYVTNAYSVGVDQKGLVAFMKAGGGVLIAGQAWNWAAGHPKENTFLQFPGNKVSGVAGIYFSVHYGKEEILPVHHQVPSSWRALDFITIYFNVCVLPKRNVPLSYHDHRMEEIQDFVAEGRGLLIGGHAWWWAYTHSGENPMTDFSGNKILNKMGLSVLEATVEKGLYKAPVPHRAMKVTYHFRHLLRRFVGHVTQGEKMTKHEEEYLEKLGTECTNFLNMKAYESYSYTHVLSILTDLLKCMKNMPQVSEKNPVKSPKDHLLLRLGQEVYNVCPDPDALLPYLIKNTQYMPHVCNQRIRINATTAEAEEWLSTGLYLSPVVIVTGFQRSIILCSPQVQIGCQTDYLKAKELKRAPSVHRRFPITTEEMQVSNLWGGLIYLVAPSDTKVEGAEVIVQMAIPAPYYKSGVTTAADWSLLRTAPSPWAELEFNNIILTVPSHVVRDLKCPNEVALLWDDIMKGVADLAVTPHKFARKERIVADVQISAGWMHSGYPIMMHSSIAEELVRPQDARTKGLWGEIHELGHNQQKSSWEFPPHTTECTCNLWSVYVHEEVLGMNRAQAHPNMTLPNRKRAVEEYVKGGKKLDNWNVWVALETYLQLQGRFGWDAFKKVFAAYHRMSNFPGDNKGKMNLYAETFSQTVGMNLTGFFKAWGWPIEPATEEKLSNLPSWSDHTHDSVWLNLRLLLIKVERDVVFPLLLFFFMGV
ncbi:hypothetical protein L3Q82_005069 [Scortum barcoo]|uniref:Uncharacterized protein n=1 Tax=Scortum barcoo TaxID=214431 RepID=A0ACB8VE09_9TELE|nr:hypothetical protein L3Q82_005069 [Scortum barcoo]